MRFSEGRVGEGWRICSSARRLASRTERSRPAAESPRASAGWSAPRPRRVREEFPRGGAPWPGARTVGIASAVALLAWGSIDQVRYYLALHDDNLPDLRRAAPLNSY